MPQFTFVTPRVSVLALRQSNAVLFWKEKAPLADDVAVLSGGVVYYPDPARAAIQGAINAWLPDLPHCRVAPHDYAVILGGVLTAAGLPLTRPQTEGAQQ